MDDELLEGLVQFKDLLSRKITVEDERKVLELDDKALELKRAREACPPSWGKMIKSVVFSEAVIHAKVAEIGRQITRVYDGQEIVCVGLLSGAFCFMTDLLRQIKVPYSVDFISCSSYGKGTVSKGSVVMLKDMTIDPIGKHILLIEDIIDTGRTLAWLKNYLSTKGCASVRIACLLDKKARRVEKHVHVDFTGFHCPDEFVVGYGMDFAGHYRGIPFIGALKPEAYGGKDPEDE